MWPVVWPPVVGTLIRKATRGYSDRNSRRTVKVQTSFYLHALGTALGPDQEAPAHKRIWQDTKKVVHILEAVCDAYGTVVDGLGTNRAGTGHRKAAAAPQAREGKRTKKAAEGASWVHVGAEGPRNQLKSRAQECHEWKLNF